jgi:GLPGLI family protein
MIRITSCFLIILIAATAHAQPKFISSGKIVFERRLDLHKEMYNRPWVWFNMDQSKTPRYYTSKHQLFFTRQETIFKRDPGDVEKSAYYNNDRSADDIIYTNLEKGIFSKKQAFFEENVFISDSLRHLKWEMTNEVRNIAGFDCHKATTIILDSVYIIAFYCDEILSRGGPLSFHNLPGAILGLVIPRMNLTYFATSIELTGPTKEQLDPPSASPQLNYESFKTLIMKTAQKFGTERRDRFLLKSLL